MITVPAALLYLASLRLTAHVPAWCATVLDARTQRVGTVCWCRKVNR